MFDKIVEQLLREAMERGEFENLANQGKPLDLSAYFDTPADSRVAFTLLKNAGVQPDEIELLGEIAALKEQLAAESDEPARARLRKQIEDRMLRFNLAVEARRRQRK